MQAIVQDRYGGPEVLITREIERTYPLSEAPQALGHVGEGNAQGKVTVTMAVRPGENSRPASIDRA
jgi:hypothetical protein